MVVPRYLETAMSTFADNQERMRSYMQEAFGGLFPFTQFEDMTKTNLAMFEQAMKMFTPPVGSDGKPAAPSAPPPSADQTAAAVRTLQAQVEQLRDQLEKLGSDKGKG